jgi:general secretion pathway protein A
MYTTYFGLSEKPFSVTPDPRFFCTNAVYQEAYASLLYGIRERQGFMVLTGEVGTGKTILLKVLMNYLEATVRCVYICQTILTFEELLSFTCEELGLPVQGAGRLQKIRRLNDFLIAQSKKRGTVVLLVDEAQNLDKEILENLRLLSNLETATEKLLQIVLVGQPELETKLDQPQLRQLKQRVVLHRRLECLKDREVDSYICHRLHVVGYDKQDLFARQAIRRIARYSQGIPRLINIICDNALLNAYGASRKTVSAEMIDEVASDNRLAEPVATTGEVQRPARPQKSHKEPIKTWKGKAVIRKRRRLAWVGLGLLLAFLLLGTLVTVIHPLQTENRLGNLSLRGKDLLGVTSKRFALLKRKLTAQLAVLLSREAEIKEVQAPAISGVLSTLELEAQDHSASHPQRDSAGKGANSSSPDSLPSVEVKGMDETTRETQSRPSRPLPTLPASDTWDGRSIAVPRGATVTKIASVWYGNPNVHLAIDLIQEFNPQIANLNLVRVGERLRLPLLTRDTLVHQQPDGTYHLILTSFPDSQEAQRFAQGVSLEGYTVMITPRSVADDLPLFRVEIAALETLDAANQAWDTALAHGWFSFADDPRLQEDTWAKHTRP